MYSVMPLCQGRKSIRGAPMYTLLLAPSHTYEDQYSMCSNAAVTAEGKEMAGSM